MVQAVTVTYPDERFAPVYGDLLTRILASGHAVSRRVRCAAPGLRTFAYRGTNRFSSSSKCWTTMRLAGAAV